MEASFVLYYVIALFVVLLDQFTKWLIVQRVNLGEQIKVIEDVLYITSHRNKGAAWGILEGQMWFFYIVTVIVVAGIVYFLQKEAKGKRLYSISLAFILGGAIGNFIDRVFRGSVVDFINTYIFTYDFPIFNIADAALTIGVVLLIIVMFKEERESKENTYGKNGTSHT
ncbi:signal peptidase II [Bacillus spongiae]|uniref:Lipoprotein signal peptidase n=1 Tax=Bacillus spongiae TaxID=2683610 RepID=A0ABU8HA54_9BACI